MHAQFRKFIRFSVLIPLFLLCHFSATAAPLLTMTLDASSFNVSPGNTVIVTGTITNRTHADLSTTDLIINFSDYDPALLQPAMLLGGTDQRLPSFSFLTDLDLFSITIAPFAAPGRYALSVLLQDSAGDFDDVLALAVIVPDPTAVPEPAGLHLIALPIGFLMFMRRRRLAGRVPVLSLPQR